MGLSCEKCDNSISAAEGEFCYYQNTMLFVCKACARKLNDELKCAMKICAALDSKKTQAEYISRNKQAFNIFLKNIEVTQRRIPNLGSLLSDIHMLVSLVKSYASGEYDDAPYNTIIIAIATLLYVISPIDIIPDVIPTVGYTDDALAVAFCMNKIHNDLEDYKVWYDKRFANL